MCITGTMSKSRSNFSRLCNDGGVADTPLAVPHNHVVPLALWPANNFDDTGYLYG